MKQSEKSKREEEMKRKYDEIMKKNEDAFVDHWFKLFEGQHRDRWQLIK